ncbi:putative Glutathione S-transferase 4 [Hypsibius exemplaris]|uniref:glutathione transferase n=1 Tax=Hypsibius exemplaris TaxID=2072580 RepID=A0A1W0WEB7_HYPEX|nr:putative Glutathione S-transferase 4 [Hypsibius exemplaris]
MAAPTYKLIYFDAPGLAEPIRWMFAYANVPFEDYRIEELPTYLTQKPSPKWDALKDQTPFGTVPVLEVNGNKFLGEAQAIARFVAKQVGLAGANDWDIAQADSIITYIASEFFSSVSNFAREQEPTSKKAALERAIIQLEKVGSTLEKMLQTNKSDNGSGFLVGKTPTVADFFTVTFCFTSDFIAPGKTAQFKSLLALQETLRGLHGVKEFVQKNADNTIEKYITSPIT